MEPPSKHGWRIGSIVWGIALLTAGLSLSGFLVRVWWLFELACHFRVQYVVVLTVAMASLLCMRKFGKAAALAPFILLNAATIAPMYSYSAPHVIRPHAKVMRLLSANVQTDNLQQRELLALVREETPDFVLLIEASKNWDASVDELKRDYPHVETYTRSDHFSFALLSRFPIEKCQWRPFGGKSMFALIAQCDVDGIPLTVIGCHTLPPVCGEYFAIRNRHFQAIAAAAARTSNQVVVAGDFNVSPLSPYFGDLMRAGRLRDSRKGFGLQPTWPVGLPGLRIAIDHCLVSSGIDVHNWRRGPDVGSDHFPILVDFSIRSTGRSGRPR